MTNDPTLYKTTQTTQLMIQRFVYKTTQTVWLIQHCLCEQDYPDYYEVIKKPMDMQRIQQKLLTNQYDNLEDMVADFVQMFDNACKYNEPESVIYKVGLMFCAWRRHVVSQ